MGVWIETTTYFCVANNEVEVTPFVGVWIETAESPEHLHAHQSLPSWVCGLKPPAISRLPPTERHSLRGCVD